MNHMQNTVRNTRKTLHPSCSTASNVSRVGVLARIRSNSSWQHNGKPCQLSSEVPWMSKGLKLKHHPKRYGFKEKRQRLHVKQLENGTENMKNHFKGTGIFTCFFLKLALGPKSCFHLPLCDACHSQSSKVSRISLSCSSVTTSSKSSKT